MPRKYPDEFGSRAIALVGAGHIVAKLASDLGVIDACIDGWVKQDRIDRGEVAGGCTVESRQLRKAKRRIRVLKYETLRRTNFTLSSSAHHPKGSSR